MPVCTTTPTYTITMSNKPEAPGYIYPEYDVQVINPGDIWGKLFILHFTHGTYGVVAESADGALDEFGKWSLRNALGYVLGDFPPGATEDDIRSISREEYLRLVEENGQDAADSCTFGVNGGEFYLNEMPDQIDEHEYTKVERVAHRVKGSMTPYITGPVDMYEIEDENGDTHFRQAYYGFGHAPEKDGGVMTVTLHKDVYAARLDMDGYLDRTDDGMFETIEDACEALIRMYGDM